MKFMSLATVNTKRACYPLLSKRRARLDKGCGVMPNVLCAERNSRADDEPRHIRFLDE